MSCPGHEELLAWIERASGDRAAPSDAALAAHVDGCPDCRARRRRLDELARSMGRPAPERMPDALRRATLTALAAAAAAASADAADRAEAPTSGAPAATPRGERLAGSLRRAREYLAELLLSGPTPALAAGLRGAGDGGHRVYAAGPYEVDVALIDRASVVGQVSADEAEMAALSGATCVLVGASTSRSAPLDPDGGFRFERLGPGAYALMIDAEGARLVLPDVDLRDGTDRGA